MTLTTDMDQTNQMNQMKGGAGTALGVQRRPAERSSRPAASVAATAVLVLLAASGCDAGADVTGIWEGEMVSQADDTVYEMKVDLAEEDGGLVGTGIITDDSGEQAPIDISGGEAEGSDVSLEFEDGFTGQAFQGRLEGELSDGEIAGEGQVYGSNSSGPIDDPVTLSLQETED